MMLKYECLRPLSTNTMRFIHVYTPARHSRALYLYCTQAQRVIILFIELLVKRGVVRKISFSVKEDTSWKKWQGLKKEERIF